jgi:hypothetical protein
MTRKYMFFAIIIFGCIANNTMPMKRQPINKVLSIYKRQDSIRLHKIKYAYENDKLEQLKVLLKPIKDMSRFCNGKLIEYASSQQNTQLNNLVLNFTQVKKDTPTTTATIKLLLTGEIEINKEKETKNINLNDMVDEAEKAFASVEKVEIGLLEPSIRERRKVNKEKKACVKRGETYKEKEKPYTEESKAAYKEKKAHEKKEKCADLLALLLDNGINPNFIKISSSFSFLKKACVLNNITLAQKALDLGADPNDQKLEYKNWDSRGDGQTRPPFKLTLYKNGLPLIIAFLKENRPLIQLLILHKAEPSITFERFYRGNWTITLHPIKLIENKMFTQFNYLLDWFIIHTNEYINVYDKNLFLHKVFLLQNIQFSPTIEWLPKDITKYITLLLFNSFKLKFDDEIEKFANGYPQYGQKCHSYLTTTLSDDWANELCKEIKEKVQEYKLEIKKNREEKEHLLLFYH